MATLAEVRSGGGDTPKPQTGRLKLGAWEALAVDYNPDDVSLTDYRQAINRSATARFAYRIGRSGVVKRLGEYTNDDATVEEWVRDNVMPAAVKVARQLLSAWYYGCVIAEPIWEAVGSDLRLRRVNVTDPEHWWSGEPERDKRTREVIGWKGIAGEPVEFFGRLGSRQIVHWAFDNEFDSAWGAPAARRVFPHYFRLSNLLKWEAVGCEVSALRRLLVFSTGDETGNQAVCDAIGQLGTNGAVALPPEVSSVQELSGGFGGGSPYTEPIDRDVVGILQAFFVAPMAVLEAKFGTRAQSETHSDSNEDIQTEMTKELAQDVLVEQVIGPGVAMRFGPNADPGEIQILDASPIDRAALQQIVTGLTNSGYMDPTSPEHIKYVGDEFEIPMEEREKNAESLPLLDRQQAQREQQVQQAQQNGKGKPEQAPTAEGRAK